VNFQKTSTTPSRYTARVQVTSLTEEGMFEIIKKQIITRIKMPYDLRKLNYFFFQEASIS
jgi:hypothetical protein